MLQCHVLAVFFRSVTRYPGTTVYGAHHPMFFKGIGGMFAAVRTGVVAVK